MRDNKRIFRTRHLQKLQMPAAGTTKFTNTSIQTMSRIPSTKALRAFEAVARLGSIKAAADQLGMSASALGRQIQALEEELNCSLFERHARGLRLTAAGRDYADSLGEIFRALAAATERVRAPQTVQLRMLAPSLPAWYLMQRLREFEQLHPGAKLWLDTFPGIPGSDPRLNDIDLAIFYGHGKWDGWDCTPLAPGGFCMPVCAPELMPNGAPDDPRELAQYTWIRPTPAPMPWQIWCAAVGHPKLQPRRYFDVANALLGADAAKRGIGIWIDGGDPVNGSGLQYHGGKLVLAHAFHAFLGDTGFYLAVRTAKPSTPMVDACRDWIIDLHRNLRRFAVTSGESA